MLAVRAARRPPRMRPPQDSRLALADRWALLRLGGGIRSNERQDSRVVGLTPQPDQLLADQLPVTKLIPQLLETVVARVAEARGQQHLPCLVFSSGPE